MNDFSHSSFPFYSRDGKLDDSDEKWPIPDSDVIKERIERRQKILEDTPRHVQNHIRNKPSSCRNITLILYDRQIYGSKHIISQEKWRRTVKKNKCTTTNLGDQSPSTVLDSPPRTSTPSPLQRSAISTALTNESATDIDLNASSPHRVIYPQTVNREVCNFGETICATQYHSSFLTHLGGDDELDENGHRPSSSRAVSTISIAFSLDGLTMASTHGDHTVKITCCSTGMLLVSLDGHPRTPWTVKYHPKDSDILASGCLGHQVRVWNWRTRTCLQMVRLEFAIISLSFHPTGKVLAIANGTKLHFWSIDDNISDDHGAGGNSGTEQSVRLQAHDQRHMLRCVHFPPDGKSLITGGVNQPEEVQPRRRRGVGNNGMSFYLRLFDFDLEKSMQPLPTESVNYSTVGKRPYANPRTFVPRALLYNDGGFDVSPDGTTLCVCAEYWLPDGVDNAMDLLHKEELAFEAERRERELTAITTECNSIDQTPGSSSIDPHSAVTAALASLKDITTAARERSEENQEQFSGSPRQPKTSSSPEPYGYHQSLLYSSGYVPRTPPVSTEPRFRNLSPPPPPGRRNADEHARDTSGGQPVPSSERGIGRGLSTPPPPPPPPPPAAPGGMTLRAPHPLSVISAPQPQANEFFSSKGRYVPHVIMVSLDTSPIPDSLRNHPRGKPPSAVAKGYRPRLGQLLEAHPLDAHKASAVTCVKFSASTDFCLIGYGVREPVVAEGGGNFHPVTAIYRIRGGMKHVSTMLSGDDDVNIARFHPHSGHSFVYGTKQGRVRVLGPRPWNFYGPG